MNKKSYLSCFLFLVLFSLCAATAASIEIAQGVTRKGEYNYHSGGILKANEKLDFQLTCSNDVSCEFYVGIDRVPTYLTNDGASYHAKANHVLTAQPPNHALDRQVTLAVFGKQTTNESANYTITAVATQSMDLANNFTTSLLSNPTSNDYFVFPVAPNKEALITVTITDSKSIDNTLGVLASYYGYPNIAGGLFQCATTVADSISMRCKNNDMMMPLGSTLYIAVNTNCGKPGCSVMYNIKAEQVDPQTGRFDLRRLYMLFGGIISVVIICLCIFITIFTLAICFCRDKRAQQKEQQQRLTSNGRYDEGRRALLDTEHQRPSSDLIPQQQPVAIYYATKSESQIQQSTEMI